MKADNVCSKGQAGCLTDRVRGVDNDGVIGPRGRFLQEFDTCMQGKCEPKPVDD